MGQRPKNNRYLSSSCLWRRENLESQYIRSIAPYGRENPESPICLVLFDASSCLWRIKNLESQHIWSTAPYNTGYRERPGGDCVTVIWHALQYRLTAITQLAHHDMAFVPLDNLRCNGNGNQTEMGDGSDGSPKVTKGGSELFEYSGKVKQ
ncbi:uncharacterized protein LOC127798823 [Diospyros lotus]|uniref:uncharacterized protein LOC127798823 n=1 Tax=Diospyros lotus TaxID=55363 RepID=UPI002258F1C1|nr:uncharacterized protein LOC127798823 [Diospyros lotus]